MKGYDSRHAIALMDIYNNVSAAEQYCSNEHCMETLCRTIKHIVWDVLEIKKCPLPDAEVEE